MLLLRQKYYELHLCSFPKQIPQNFIPSLYTLLMSQNKLNEASPNYIYKGVSIFLVVASYASSKEI